MFSGIVKGTGHVSSVEALTGDRRLVIDYSGVALGPLEPGASVAVNGVCLTVTDCHANSFAADVSNVTLAATTLGSLQSGSPVNLEPSLRLGDFLDGHLVSGHVDGVGRVLARRPDARSVGFTIALPASLARFVAQKGSVAVDGVSLTVNAVGVASDDRDDRAEAASERFSVNVIPATMERTIIATYAPGSAVNIEVDIIARYLDRLRAADA